MKSTTIELCKIIAEMSARESSLEAELKNYTAGLTELARRHQETEQELATAQEASKNRLMSTLEKQNDRLLKATSDLEKERAARRDEKKAYERSIDGLRNALRNALSIEQGQNTDNKSIIKAIDALLGLRGIKLEIYGTRVALKDTPETKAMVSEEYHQKQQTEAQQALAIVRDICKKREWIPQQIDDNIKRIEARAALFERHYNDIATMAENDAYSKENIKYAIQSAKL